MLPQEGGGKQGLDIKALCSITHERVCNSGLLVVTATVNGFVKPLTILIDPEESSNYSFRQSLKGSHTNAEALGAQDIKVISVRLETGTCVTVPNIDIYLSVKFWHLSSVKGCLVLDLDT